METLALAGGVLSSALFLYLGYALLFPERLS